MILKQRARSSLKAEKAGRAFSPGQENRVVLQRKERMIIEKLNEIRMPGRKDRKRDLCFTIACAAAGILLGIFSKWLDSLALDPDIGWHRVIERFDLGNFFSDIAIWLLAALLIAMVSQSAFLAGRNVLCFFAGMCAAYHLYTVLFAGFNPMSYMLVWYGATLLSPILAVLCWYAGGKGRISLVLDTGIVAVFFLACFSIGFLYFHFRGILYLLVFVWALALIYKSKKQMMIALPSGLLLAFLSASLWPFR